MGLSLVQWPGVTSFSQLRLLFPPSNTDDLQLWLGPLIPPVGHTCVLKISDMLSFLHHPPPAPTLLKYMVGCLDSHCFLLGSDRALDEIWCCGAWHRSPGWGRVPVLWTTRVTASPLASMSSCGGQIWASDFKAPPTVTKIQTLTAPASQAPSCLKQLGYVGHPNDCSGCSGSLQWCLALFTCPTD